MQHQRDVFRFRDGRASRTGAGSRTGCHVFERKRPCRFVIVTAQFQYLDALLVGYVNRRRFDSALNDERFRTYVGKVELELFSPIRGIQRRAGGSGGDS